MGTRHKITPLQAVLYGAAAGLAASLLLSALARVLPGMRRDKRAQDDGKPKPPEDPFDPDQVHEWQRRSWSPAGATRNPEEDIWDPHEPHAITPASILVKAESPGPEGLAQQFAFKLASGLFDRDISPILFPAGAAVHLVYGSTWGAICGLIQASRGWPSTIFGPLFGVAIYAIGPAALLPAMKIMEPPTEEPPLRTTMLIAGHIVFGLATVELFNAMQREIG
jgi:hypothetical protein